MTEKYQPFITLRFDNVQRSISAKSAGTLQTATPTHIESAAQVKSAVGSSIEELIEDDIEDQPGIEDDTEDQPELPKDVRIGLSHKAWKDANGQLSMRKAARIFGISRTTLQGCINSAVSKAEACQERQRLCVTKKEVI